MSISAPPHSELTIIITRDYKCTAASESYDDFLAALQGLSTQQFESDFNIMIVVGPGDATEITEVTSERFGAKLDVQIIEGPSDRAIDQRNYAYNHVKSRFVLDMDADCVLHPRCLTHLLAAMHSSESVGVVSAITSYGDDSSWRRIASLFDRPYGHLQSLAPTTYLSANCALFRRELLLEHKLRAGPPFTISRSRTEGLISSGVGLFVEPRAIAYHAHNGLKFCHDYHRSAGFAWMYTHPSPQYGLIPNYVVRTLWRDLRLALRQGPRRLHWRDWLLVPAVVLMSRYYRVLGMFDALRGEPRAVGTGFV